jgi:type IV pilus assembly protein PilE
MTMATRSSLHPGRRKGFTLVELMVTVAIVAILAVIATPVFNQQIHKSRRTEARTTLLDLAARAERQYSTSNTYWGNTTAGKLLPPDLGYSGGWPITTTSGYYTILLSNNGDGTAFTFTATAAGAQSTDTQCATMSVDNTGNQTASDPGCWK